MLPEKGSIFRNPQLARSLRTIGRDGRDAFYRGPIADVIVRYSQSAGGLFSLSDFAEHTSTFVEPVSTNYRGYDVWELPPNGQGIAVLQMLNLLEPFDLKSLGPQSAETLHLMIEAKKLAYEDRAKFYADPEFAHLPVASLISKSYAERRRVRINPDRANLNPVAGDPAQADTIYLTVVDRDFNCVSLIQSNFHDFGSHHVPGELGFVLQNRGSLFALDPDHLNRLEPQQAALPHDHSGLHHQGRQAVAVIRPDGGRHAGPGARAGDLQPDRFRDGRARGRRCAPVPALRFVGADRAAGQGRRRGRARVGNRPGVRRRLEAKGHRLARCSRAAFGGYQAIRIDVERGVLMGGSDPRKDGAAMGY